MSSGKNSKNQLPMTEKISLPVLTEPGREIQIDFFGKLHNKHVTGQPYILNRIGRYSIWPVVRICKSTEAREVIKFLESFINMYGVPEKTKSDRGSAVISKVYGQFCINENIEIEYRPLRLHTAAGAVERATQTLKKFNHCQLRRQDLFYRELKPGSASNAIYQAYRTQSEPI